MKLYISGILLILINNLFAQTPMVKNVRFEQRTDGTLLVDIYYDVTSPNNLLLEIKIEASDNDGTTWTSPCKSLSGDVGAGILPGSNKHVVWDFYADNPDTSGYGYRVRVTANLNMCGQIITDDLSLTEDIICHKCNEYVLKIDAPNVTLDLGGHTISSDVHNEGVTGIYVENTNGVTIRNGTIDKDFSWAIGLYNADSVTIENMVIRNMEFASPDTFIMGIIASNCHDVVVQDCQFEYLNVHHKEAIVMGGNVEFTVDSIEVNGGSVGVHFGGYELPSNGTVTNSRFVASKIAGVLVNYTTNCQVANNIFENGNGVSVEPPVINREITGVTIEENDFLNGENAVGVQLRGAINVNVLNNNIRNNGTGISLIPSEGCNEGSENGPNCYYSTNNIIKDNVVLGNDLDLYHHEKCIGNTWEGNTYETALGFEIYKIGPATAKQYVTSVDSAAAEVASDAQLLFVTPFICDTTGKSMRWIYIYQSASQQKNYEFWVNDGKVVTRDYVSIPWMIGEGFLPFTGFWIDSDSAIVIAEGMGGKDFREEFDLINVEMSLAKTHWFFWTVNYISQDTTFQASFDASME